MPFFYTKSAWHLLPPQNWRQKMDMIRSKITLSSCPLK
uniref:Uncharacterized protein n=1 Tax=Arundo donax TaxID=35708 RepID=A0A0A9FI54_ARUDO